MAEDGRDARSTDGPDGPDGPTVDDAGRVVTGDSDDPGREFDWRGWVLIGWLFLAIVVVPAYLYFYPRAGESLAVFGLGYRATFLVLPLVPAILLGLLAVWATTRP